MSIRASRGSRRQQRGIVLFVCLALLTALTVGGLAAAQTTTLELRMARNQHDTTLALHAAEFALSAAEAWLQSTATDPTTLFATSGNGLYRAAGYGEAAIWRDASAWRTARAAGTLPNVSTPPRYLVEWLGTHTDAGTPSAAQPPLAIDIFRITARGTGARAAATLQSTYGRARASGPARSSASRVLTGRLSWVEVRG